MASEAQVDLVISTDGALPQLQADLVQIVNQAEATAPEIDLEVDVDQQSVSRSNRSFSSLIRSATQTALSMGRMATQVGAVGVALGSALPVVAGAAAAIQQIAPAAAVSVTALGALVLAAATVQLAMKGVSEAIELAFDPDAKPEELEKALKRLAPEARKFVVELRSMRGALGQVQREVQNRFFEDFDRVLEGLASSTLPVVRGALNRTATSLNLMARGAANAANELAEDGTLGTALDGAAKGLENLEGLPGQIVKSLGQIGAAAAPAFDKLTRRIDTAATAIAEDIERAFESGALEDEVDQAISALGQLKRVGENLLGGIGNIFRGLTEDGRGLFQILEDISRGFEELTASEDFQDILGGLVLVADQLVESAMPLLKKAFEELAPVIRELAPLVARFIEEVGPELIPVLEELGPILLTIVRILEDQLPFAIEFSKALLQTFTVILKFVGFVLEEILAPALRLAAKLFDNDYTRSIADASRETATSIQNMLGRFEAFRERVSSAVTAILGRLGAITNFLRVTFLSEITGALATIVGRFAALPGQIRGAMGDVASLLFSVGVNLMRGLIGGILSQVDRLLGIARGIAESVSGTIESALDIASPSRVMKRIGEFTGEGLVIGLRSMVPDVESASLALAGPIAPSFALGDGRSLSLARVTGASPVVNVFIGNEQLDARTDARIRANNRARDRVLSQGIRR